MADILKPDLDITPAYAPPVPRGMLIPVGGVDPANQRTYLSSALQVSNGGYNKNVEEINKLISIRAANNVALDNSSNSQLTNSVNQRVAVHDNVNKAFAVEVEKKENFGRPCPCRRLSHGFGGAVLPRLIHAARNAAAIVGDDRPRPGNDTFGNSKLNNAIILEHVGETQQNSRPEHAVDKIFKQYANENQESSNVGIHSNVQNIPSAEEQISEITIADLKEMPGNGKNIPKQQSEDSALNSTFILAIAIIIFSFTLILYFTNVLGFDNSEMQRFLKDTSFRN